MLKMLFLMGPKRLNSFFSQKVSCPIRNLKEESIAWQEKCFVLNFARQLFLSSCNFIVEQKCKTEVFQDSFPVKLWQDNKYFVFVCVCSC